MKKIILSIVFVFASFAMVNAKKVYLDCWEEGEIAVEMANHESSTWYGTGWLTYEEEYEVFAEAYENCENYNNI